VEAVTREIFWHISLAGKVVMYLLLLNSFFGAPLYLAYQWWNRVCLGTATNRFDKVPERLRRLLFDAAKVTSDHCGVTRDDIIS